MFVCLLQLAQETVWLEVTCVCVFVAAGAGDGAVRGRRHHGERLGDFLAGPALVTQRYHQRLQLPVPALLSHAAPAQKQASNVNIA